MKIKKGPFCSKLGEKIQQQSGTCRSNKKPTIHQSMKCWKAIDGNILQQQVQGLKLDQVEEDGRAEKDISLWAVEWLMMQAGREGYAEQVLCCPSYTPESIFLKETVSWESQLIRENWEQKQYSYVVTGCAKATRRQVLLLDIPAWSCLSNRRKLWSKPNNKAYILTPAFSLAKAVNGIL